MVSCLMFKSLNQFEFIFVHGMRVCSNFIEIILYVALGESKFFFFFGLFAISWAAPAAYGGSQARGLIGAVATSLCQSHSNAGSEPRL